MASKPYPLRIPKNLLFLVDSKASEDKTDRSTVLRQLLYTGAEDYAIELLECERISASRAARLLDVSLYKMHELMRESGVKVDAGSEGYGSRQETADQLLG